MKVQELLEWAKTDKGIRPHLEALGYKYLGKGVDQSAYLELRTGKVLKIFGRADAAHTRLDNGHSRDHLMFKEWVSFCNKNKSNPFVPKFDGWEAFEFKGEKYLQIRMERLQKLPPKLSETLNAISEKIEPLAETSSGRNSIYRFAKDPKPENLLYRGYSGLKLFGATHDYERDEGQINQLVMLLGAKKFEQFIHTIVELRVLASKHRFAFDLHGDNFMHRNDGVPVIVDPWVFW